MDVCLRSNLAHIHSSKDYVERIRPVSKPPSRRDGQLAVEVLYTSLPACRAALAAASVYGRDLDARITVVAAQVVPYPLPLEKPPADTAVLEQRLGALAAQQSLETEIQIYLCRDKTETLRRVLERNSTVVIGSSTKWWWPWPERRLAATLRLDGHRVIRV